MIGVFHGRREIYRGTGILPVKDSNMGETPMPQTLHGRDAHATNTT